MTNFKLAKSHYREGGRDSRRSEQGRDFLGEHLVQQSHYIDEEIGAQRWEALGSWSQLAAELMAELESTIPDSRLESAPRPALTKLTHQASTDFRSTLVKVRSG